MNADCPNASAPAPFGSGERPEGAVVPSELSSGADRLNEIRQWLGAKPALSSAEAGSVRICRELLAALDAAEQRAADEKARYTACCEEREEIKRLTTYKSIGELQALVAQAEQERDEPCESCADLETNARRFYDEKVAAEKERDDAAFRAVAAQDRLDEVVKERDEWQELATRLAEEAGVDAEQMLAQARAEVKP